MKPINITILFGSLYSYLKDETHNSTYRMRYILYLNHEI